MLPEAVLAKARDELLEWDGAGASVMEISHRSKDFIGIAERAETDLRELLRIPENYKVLFLQGGATLQFAMVPMNLLDGKKVADYVNTGHWSKKAMAEAERFMNVHVAATSEDSDFTTIPPQSSWQLHPDSAYVHFTPNETIGGLEFQWTPDTGDVPLVADMSSTILSRPIDVSKFGVIYAGAQKNIGPAGVTVVIVREDLLGKTAASAPSLFNYQKQAESGSMMNTAPTFAWYMSGLVFEWLKEQGGLSVMAEINERKAGKLYACIDESDGFYKNQIDSACRSRMNVTFTLAQSELDAVFLQSASEAGLVALKGHRSVGGMRASIYNAMPEKGVDMLVELMINFQRRHT
jgi:phosphoserine aminotransferase